MLYLRNLRLFWLEQSFQGRRWHAMRLDNEIKGQIMSELVDNMKVLILF